VNKLADLEFKDYWHHDQLVIQLKLLQTTLNIGAFILKSCRWDVPRTLQVLLHYSNLQTTSTHQYNFQLLYLEFYNSVS